MRALTVTLLCITLCSLCKAQPIVDYRIYQSPVKDQVHRGTCTAFALVAAMETFPGFPTDLSEQYLYALAKSYSYNDDKNYDEGAFLDNYLKLMTYQGTVREDQEPYNPDKVIIDTTLSNFDNMKSDIGGTRLLKLLQFQKFSYKLQPAMYIYRDNEDVWDIDFIRKMLDDGAKAIVVCYRVNGHYWSRNTGAESDKMDPNDFLTVDYNNKEYSFNEAYQLLGEDLFNKDDGFYYTDTIYRLNGGHAVTIVGYDATGFLIKNSWNSNWGDEGYFWLSFNYHKMYATEIMVPKLGKVYVDPKIPDNNDWNAGEFYIKSLPVVYNSAALNMHTKSISLSVVYHGNTQMPRFTEIEYNVYDANNKNLGTYYGSTQGVFDGRETGYETYILQQSGNYFPSAYKIVAKFTTAGGRTFTNTYYNISAVNKEYKPGN